MTPDLLGAIGGLQFVTADRAFREAATAERDGHFGHHNESGRRTSASRAPTAPSATRKKKRR